MLLKINLEKIEEELKKVALEVFGEDTVNIEILDQVEIIDSPVDDCDLAINIYNRGEKSENLDYICIEQVHVQYDFDTETLFGFYESYARKDEDTDKRFDRVAAEFNKKKELHSKNIRAIRAI